MEQDLTVWCVCVGDKYSTSYVYALKEMVSKYLTLPHSFKCITTEKLTDIETVLPYVPYQGWWSKFSLWERAKGPSIYFDLDVVIVGNIDYLVNYTNTFSAPPNWAQSGYGGIQSSVMCWPGNWRLPLDVIDWPADSEKYWGDQEFLHALLKNDWEKIPGIGSYKYHVMNNKKIPEWMNVCVFHGKPDPHEVKDECLLSFMSIHDYSIK